MKIKKNSKFRIERGKKCLVNDYICYLINNCANVLFCKYIFNSILTNLSLMINFKLKDMSKLI